jgi:hypothetical protein
MENKSCSLFKREKRIWLLWYQLANSGKLKKAGKRTKTLVPFDDAWWKWKPCMID